MLTLLNSHTATRAFWSLTITYDAMYTFRFRFRLPKSTLYCCLPGWVLQFKAGATFSVKISYSIQSAHT